MNYKLCKQLKDNGFPFRTTFENKLTELMIPTSKKIIQYLDTRDYLIRFDDKWFYIPSLSELIEAIDDGGYIILEKWEDKWTASALGFMANAKTPKIAVTNLYLKLNKPNKK